jgi:O-antigen ligase
MQGRIDWRGYSRRVDWSGISVWLLALSLVVYLGLKGGGYDPLVHDQAGIAVWWVLLAATVAGALPRRRPTPLAWAALGLLAAFVVWTALSLSWTESVERSWADLARVSGYLGVFALALFVRDSRAARQMVAAVGTGIARVALIGLLSRFHPSWFPAANETVRFLTTSRERLAYPLHYWNAVAALIAIGLPLLLHIATGARSLLARSLAAAALPALALTVFYTLSRGGTAAAVIALAVFFAFTSERLARLPTLLLTAAGGALLILAANSRDALQEGLLNPTAADQGNEMLLITIAVCAVAFLGQAGISLAARRWPRPRWTVPPRQVSLGALAAGALALIVAAAVWGAPGRVSDAWGNFKDTGGPGEGTGRLNSVAGEGRYQFWVAARHENASAPLTGTGSGTFEFWWNRNGDTRSRVRDTHNLYMQTLGELGIVGLALLAAFLGTVLVGGAWLTVKAGSRGRPQLAAALAGCVAFCVTAIFDWMWQIPVLPVATLLLAAVLLSAGGSRPDRRPFPWIPRLAIGLGSLAAIAAIAVPLAAEAFTRQSQADFQAGDLTAALEKARSAQNVEPAAATPRLQQALVLERLGELEQATAAARAATERESTNWRTWLVLSRIEAERGRAAASLHAYRKAGSLDPRSYLFAP